MNINIKRVYEPACADDGARILVDRLWPRGLSKADAKIDLWLKELAPSNELRRWYSHDPTKWSTFRDRYFAELASDDSGIDELLPWLRWGKVTFLYASKEARLNNAAALREYLAEHLQQGSLGGDGGGFGGFGGDE